MIDYVNVHFHSGIVSVFENELMLVRGSKHEREAVLVQEHLSSKQTLVKYTNNCIHTMSAAQFLQNQFNKQSIYLCLLQPFSKIKITINLT